MELRSFVICLYFRVKDVLELYHVPPNDVRLKASEISPIYCI